MLLKFITRQFHCNRSLWDAPKSSLAALRKSTGYTIANCKKALEIHNNDLTKAEEWLREQAQSLGWMKVSKLQGRKTAQGLVGILVRNNVGAMVELNCETDFVARNSNFQDMVVNVASTCAQLAEVMPSAGAITKRYLNSEQLKELKASDGKPLSDHLALLVGTVGENSSLQRAVYFKSDNGIHLSGYAHPSGSLQNEVLLGRLGGIIAVKAGINDQEEIDMIGKKVCQHVVGMDPKKIGSESDTPDQDKDNEECLIFQSYLHDESYTVDEVLKEYRLEVVDFDRFECGSGNMS